MRTEHAPDHLGLFGARTSLAQRLAPSTGWAGWQESLQAGGVWPQGSLARLGSPGGQGWGIGAAPPSQSHSLPRCAEAAGAEPSGREGSLGLERALCGA